MHITEKISSYINHELPQEERQAVAEHLLGCQKCRGEHERIKFGAALASNLKRMDAPENTWLEIKKSLDEKPAAQTSLLPPLVSFFNLGGLSVTVAPLLIVFSLAAIVYLNLFPIDQPEVAQNDPAAVVQEKTNTALPLAIQNPSQISIHSNETAPKQKEPANIPFWQVETLAGAPTTQGQAISKNGILAVGNFLVTDANSRARVQVANIGQVEIAPNSRVRLVKTESTEHRLSLERGVLHAMILAPPRLFIVDTPSAVAVDLGCAYKLEVDKAGNTRLHVTSGFVALERNGRESIVPAGAVCLTRRGKGIGTPFFDDASPSFQAALTRFDFAGGGSTAVRTIIKESRSHDTLTLWHLLSRVSPNERGKVFDALAGYVKIPSGATRDGILNLDKKMLERWRTEIENLWFE